MINHELKCIFIHPGRTGGTSIEVALDRHDWWDYKQDEKHLKASEARVRYAPYWDSYFKFSCVRNPYQRLVSMYSWTRHKLKMHDFQFDEYLRSDLMFDPQKKCPELLVNFINERLDYIIRFENLEDDFKQVCLALGVTRKLDKKLPSPIKKSWHDYYTEPWMVDTVRFAYEEDLDRFGYQDPKWLPKRLYV